MEHYSVIKHLTFAIFHNMVGPGGYHANNIRQAEKTNTLWLYPYMEYKKITRKNKEKINDETKGHQNKHIDAQDRILETRREVAGGRPNL